MIKGVIFDMDGVLFNTERIDEDSWMKVHDETGLDIDREFVRHFFGNSKPYVNRLFYDRFGEGFDSEPYRIRKNEFIAEFISKNGVPLKKGVVELLDFLTERGLKHTIATSTSRKTTLHYLHISGLEKYFDLSRIVCGDMVKNGKPEPEIYLTASRQLELEPDECIAFEDSPPGIHSAHRAGVHPIMVPDLIAPTPELDEICLERLESLSDAIPLIRNLLK